MKQFTLFSLFALMFVMLVIGCKTKPQGENTSSQDTLNPDSTILVVASDTLMFMPDSTAETNLAIEAPTPDTTGQGGLFRPKSKIFKLWKTWFDECVASDTWTDADYLGIGNPNNLGSVTDKKKQVTLQELSTIISDGELSKVRIGRDSLSCKAAIETDLDISTILESNISVDTISNALEAELQAELKKSKKSVLVVNRYERQDMVFANLGRVLNNNSTPEKQQYKKDLNNKQNRFLNRVIIVHDFTIEITFSKTISAELKAKLNKGVIANVADGNGSVNFKLNTDGNLQARTKVSFPVLGQFGKFANIIQ